MKVDYYLNGLPYFTTAPETTAGTLEPTPADVEKIYLDLLTEHEKHEGIKRAEGVALEKITEGRVYCLEKLRGADKKQAFSFWIDRIQKTYVEERRARDYFTRLLNDAKQ